ncbi:MAG: LamG-like jellyroll fold domain-containing protein [Verrucomicrobiota bacterium JB024]|nr:LamG-like jellyroll fold domain-containing protein [Verrucomicrobiota bacterium JB024]
MSTFPKTRIRIAADLFSYTAFGDVLRAAEDDYRPKFRAGDDIQFEIGLFNNGELLDLSGIAAVTLEIKPLDSELTERFDEDDDADNYDLRGPDLNLTPIRSKTLSASELNATLTKSGWDSNASEQCHALIALSSAESNIAAGDRWLSIGIVTGDSPGRIRTVCAGPIRVLGGGLSQAASPEGDTPETFYNTAEADARYLKLANNLSDLADSAAARGHLGLGEADSPSFGGLTISSGGVVDFNDNRLIEVGDAIGDTDGLNRQSADARYLKLSESGADIADPDAFRDHLSIYSRKDVDTLAAKTFGPALYLDGVTGAVTLPAAVGAAFASSSTIAIRLRLADGRPAAVGCLLGYSTGAIPDTSFQLLLNTNGSLKLLLRDGTSEASTQSAVLFADGPSREVTVVATIDTVAGVATLYLDGSQVASLDISTMDFAAGIWGAPALGALLSSGTPGTRLAAYFVACAIYNHALSATEVAERYGLQPTWPVVSAQKHAAGVVFAPDFSTINTYTSGILTTLDNNGVSDGATTFDDCLSLTCSVNQSQCYISFIADSFAPKAGETYRVTGWAYAPSSNSTIDAIAFKDGQAGNLISNYPSGIIDISGQWTRIDFTYTASVSDMPRINMANVGQSVPNIGFDATTGDIIYLQGLKYTKLGARAYYDAAQDSRVGYQLRDLGGNGLHGLHSPTGCTWLEAGTRGQLTLSGFTADAWLGGSERALIPAGYRIAEIIATETAGVGVNNLALGTTANGTDLVSSFSLLSNETKSLAVAAPFAAKSVTKPVHLNDAPGGSWGGAKITLTFILEKF